MPRFGNNSDREARKRLAKASKDKLLKKLGQGTSSLPSRPDSGSLSDVKLTIDQLRANLRDAADKSGLSYSEIGMRMGQPDIEAAKNKVSYLLNRAADPGILTILSFCEAIGQDIKSVLKNG